MHPDGNSFGGSSASVSAGAVASGRNTEPWIWRIQGAIQDRGSI